VRTLIVSVGKQQSLSQSILIGIKAPNYSQILYNDVLIIRHAISVAIKAV